MIFQRVLKNTQLVRTNTLQNIDSLKILSLNIQSVNSKKQPLWDLLNDQDPYLYET